MELSKLNSVAKLVLKMRFKTPNSLVMQLVSINKDYVKKNNLNNYNYYKDEDNDFVLWSMQEFIFNERQLRLPDEESVKEVMVHEHEFKNDEERYETLKKLYNTLQGWSVEMDFIKGFKLDSRQRIVVAGDYWYIS